MIAHLRNALGDLGKNVGKTGTAQMPALKRPDSGTISIKGKIRDMPVLQERLRSTSLFQTIEVNNDTLRASMVESTDRKKKPHLYADFVFGSHGLNVTFSIPLDHPHPKARSLEVMRTVFTLVSLLEAADAFSPERAELYTQVMEAFNMRTELMDPDPLRMKYLADAYAVENNSIKNELSKLKAENEGLNHSLMELERRYQKLVERVGVLERMTDSELDREIIKWVEEHNGKFESGKFCNSFDINGQRLEERLDALSKSGVIRIV